MIHSDQPSPQHQPSRSQESGGLEASEGGQSFAPPTFQLQASSSSIPIQRKVDKFVDDKDGKTYWWTDADDSQRFDSFEEALAYERHLTGATDRRTSTLYTYTHTKSHNKVSSRAIPQGPHTYGFASVHQGFQQATQGQKLMHILTEQCVTPSDWKKLVIAESQPNIFTAQGDLAKRIQRAYGEYNNLYQSCLSEIQSGSPEVGFVQEMIRTLINLHPYATYKWNTTQQASKKELKGKGETSDLFDPKNIDQGGKFKNKQNFQDFVYDRQDLVDDDYDPNGGDMEVDSDDMEDDLEL